jgi:18S rRNA (guanine1575-N7)-methyltransferase
LEEIEFTILCPKLKKLTHLIRNPSNNTSCLTNRTHKSTTTFKPAAMSRPEDILPPDLFYNDVESRKYTTSSRVKNIQASMTNRALELLDLDSPSLILDIGCGSGLSGEILSDVTEEEGGPHTWFGMDISSSMLAEALDRDVEGDMLLADMGQGIPFRAGTFDAAISISAIQWLCNAESSDVTPEGRLKRFFDGLYMSLKRGGKAVCQFYPKNAAQRSMISNAAIKAGFGAGILEDDPDTKSLKVYLVLTVGGGDVSGTVRNMSDVDIQDARKKDRKRGKEFEKKGSKQWIMRKKAQSEAKGKIVKPNSKFTGRRRKTAW